MDDKLKIIAEIESDIEVLYNKIEELENTIVGISNYSEVYEEIFVLKKRITDLKRKIIITKGPTYTNGKLNLYLDDGSIESEEEIYKIALVDTENWIGTIRVTHVIHDYLLANIGYELIKEARGNGYMIQALEILRQPLIDKGLSKPVLSVDPENIPSVRTIEKFGGKKINIGDKWFDTYEVDLTDESHKIK